MKDFEIIDEIEKVRSKNNINWMNILRLAFKYAPKETRKILSKMKFLVKIHKLKTDLISSIFARFLAKTENRTIFFMFQ